MKYLKLFNESSNEDKRNLEISNEILDLFIDLKDLGCEIEINACKYGTPETFDIQYSIDNVLSFENDWYTPDESFVENLEKSKEQFKVFNEYMRLSYEFLERLKNTDYKIRYFDVDFEPGTVVDRKVRTLLRVTTMGPSDWRY
jgi:hypothetical protein